MPRRKPKRARRWRGEHHCSGHVPGQMRLKAFCFRGDLELAHDVVAVADALSLVSWRRLSGASHVANRG